MANSDDVRKRLREMADQTLELKVDRRTTDALQRDLAKHEYGYGRLGLALGLVCILGGIALFLNGVAGSTSWTAKLLGAESQITDAAPGAILFIVGVFLVLITRPKYEHK